MTKVKAKITIEVELESELTNSETILNNWIAETDYQFGDVPYIEVINTEIIDSEIINITKSDYLK